jgi:DNA modification methylase
VRRLEVSYQNIGLVKADPRNARTHPKSQVEQIAASIRQWGFTNPILVDEDGCIIAGHGRLLGAKALGMTAVPTIVLSGLRPEDKRALRLADNRIALNSGWDTELLRVELADLSSMDLSFDLELTGFSAPELDIAVTKAKPPIEEEAPGLLPAVPVTQPGDIWILGPHRVGCGDCRDGLIEQVMNGSLADAAFLDPPYNIKISGFAVAKGRHPDFQMAVGEMSAQQFQDFLIETLGACARISRNGAVHFCAMDWRHVLDLMAAGQVVYGETLNLCVWNKSNAGMGNLYRSKHELIVVFRVGDAQHYNAVELGKHGRNRTNVWDYGSVNSFDRVRSAELELHPTVKPTQLVADALMDVTRRGDVVLDAFLGSGTTLIATERTGRIFRGMELEPAYVDTAIERWCRVTGGDAYLEETGELFAVVQAQRIPEAIG